MTALEALGIPTDAQLIAVGFIRGLICWEWFPDSKTEGELCVHGMTISTEISP